MTLLPTKELYQMFLLSDFWINLSRTKRRLVGKCEKCSTQKDLQSHHVFYRDNWFDTRLEDLLVLCRKCHEEVHHLNGSDVEPRPIVRKAEPNPKRLVFGIPELPHRRISDKKQLEMLRSQKLISRVEYLRRREEFIQQGKWTRQKVMKHKVRVYKTSFEKARERIRNLKCTPWHYHAKYRSKWVNRGTSSN